MDYSSVRLPKVSPVLTLFAAPEAPLEIYICQPTSFVQDNLEKMLPDWTLPTAWVVIVLQKARFSLCSRSNIVEQEKQRLRERFMRFGVEVAFALKEQGALADLIDPRSGQPLLSHAGILSHDDVKVVSTLLGFQTDPGDCTCIIHPHWGNAVYPGVMLSSANPKKIKAVLETAAHRFQWQVS